MRPSSERRAHAMGTMAHVIVVGSGADLRIDSALDRIDELEKRWSRFLPDSEISLLNSSNGGEVLVSDDTLLLFAHAASASRLTNGAFNPMMERQLAAAGYDRSFETLGLVESAELGIPGSDCSDICIDDQCRTVALPAGIGFDPGGIGKGLAADIVAEELIAAGALGALVSLGGDMAVRGTPPEGDEWVIEIREPAVSADVITTVSLVEGGLATSTSAKRRWEANGSEQHHILDPRTGQPRRDGPILATVIAGDAWWAEAAATAMIVGATIDPASCASLALTAGGSQIRNGDFWSYES